MSRRSSLGGLERPVPGVRDQGRRFDVQRSTFNVEGRTAGIVLVMVTAAILACAACQTAGTAQPEPVSFEVEAALLQRPLPGPFVALYRLRVPSTGGLRLSVIADRGQGRMTVSENLGGAVVVAGWDDQGGSVVFDLRKGCRLEGEHAVEALGLGSLPLSRVILLLGGRIPALEGDQVTALGSKNLFEIAGAGWWSVAELAREPSRVVALRGEDWEVELHKHTSSVPGDLRIDTPSGDWAELELVRLQWEFSGELPPLPELPVCGR